ncbi:MAG: type II toxin-antitoxin system RelE/ParE family toxin [Desulfonatronovibrio sp.]|nr:type II toxin-antitoxin system RelE/ParE family toxin [Desulfovibrionales bacterium]
MKVRILSAAANDLFKAKGYYESQSDGLGADFLNEYEKTISRICKFPQAWIRLNPHLRRCLMRRFPYAVLYTVMEKEIVVTAIADLRMDPDSIHKLIHR